MKKLCIGVLLSITMLTGCATVSVPVDRKISAKKVCGPLAKRDCAPAVGSHFAFKKQYKTMPVDSSGNPQVMSYLGTIIRRNAQLFGEPGAVCGGGSVSPFKSTDRSSPTFGNEVTLVYTLDQKSGIDFGADLKQAMLASGVPAAKADSLEAKIGLAVSRLKKATVRATAKFSEYQLTNAALRELDAATTSGRLNSCLEEIIDGEWRIYQAVSGLYVSQGELDSDTQNTIIANLAAEVKTIENGADIARLKANFESVVTEKIKTATDPYFVAIGASFYRSPRHPKIN